MTSTSRKVVVHCTFCDRPYNYIIPEIIPKNARIYCKDCKKQFRIRSQLATSQSSPKEIIKEKSRSSHSQDDKTSTNTFIDDPDELLLSTAIRELNKPDPDPRWATILINCKKEKITTKGDVLDQFRQLNTQALVNILSKSLQNES